MNEYKEEKKYFKNLCLTNINFLKMQFNFQNLLTLTYTQPIIYKQILTISIHLFTLSNQEIDKQTERRMDGWTDGHTSKQTNS